MVETPRPLGKVSDLEPVCRDCRFLTKARLDDITQIWQAAEIIILQLARFPTARVCQQASLIQLVNNLFLCRRMLR